MHWFTQICCVYWWEFPTRAFNFSGWHQRFQNWLTFAQFLLFFSFALSIIFFKSSKNEHLAKKSEYILRSLAGTMNPKDKPANPTFWSIATGGDCKKHLLI